MTIVNSAFTVNGSLPTDAIAVAAGSTVTLQVQNTTGINGVVWSIAGNDNKLRANPVITATGNVGATASFVMPADVGDGLGQSYRVKCKASDGGSPPNISTTFAVVGIANQTAVVPIAAGEELDRDLTYGWTMPFNRALAGPATVPHGLIQLADGIHGIAGLGPYTSAGNRQAAVLASTDVTRVARQTDTSPASYWIVDSVSGSVGTWLQIVTAADNTTSPLSIFGSSLLAWYRGDTVTIGTGVSQWTDKSTAGTNHLIQATTGSQPAYTASDSTLNNRGTLLGNGTSTYLNNVSMTIPATCFIWFVIKQVTWTSLAKIIDWPASSHIMQYSATPSIVAHQSVATTDNAGAALGSWKRGYARLDNTTADAMAVGSIVRTGTAIGRSAASNNTSVFSQQGGGGAWFNGYLAEIAIVNRLPTGPELTAIDAYGSAYYLPSILT